MSIYDLNNIDELAKFSEELPDDKLRDFELSITQLVKNKELTNLRNNLKNILRESKKRKIKYAAFYSLVTMHRYNKNFFEAERLVYVYNQEFSGIDTYKHLQLLCQVDKGIPVSINDIDKAYDNMTRFCDNAGAAHLYADIVATFFEKSFMRIDDKNNDITREALKAVESAIRLNQEYAKYYYTKSRLLFIEGKYEEALIQVNRAIEKESPKNINYSMRVNDYQIQRMKLLIEIGKKEVVKNTDNMINNIMDRQKEIMNDINGEIDRINNNLIKNIELIGFFAGIVALALGSIQIVAQQGFENATKLIIVLLGSLLCAFSGLGVILHGFKKKTIASLFVFIFGVIIIGGVLLFF